MDSCLQIRVIWDMTLFFLQLKYIKSPIDTKIPSWQDMNEIITQFVITGLDYWTEIFSFLGQISSSFLVYCYTFGDLVSRELIHFLDG